MSLIVPSASGNKALSEGRGVITHFQFLSGVLPSSQSTLTFRWEFLSAKALIYLHIMRELAPGEWGCAYAEVCTTPCPPGSPHFLNIMAVSSLLFDISAQTTTHDLNLSSPLATITSFSSLLAPWEGSAHISLMFSRALLSGY